MPESNASFERKTEPFPLENLALVRMLLEPPRVVGGRILLETAFQISHGRTPKQLLANGLKGTIPRITLHFSLNDGVRATGLGGNSWRGADYVVVGSLQQVMRENPDARLLNLLGGDTYFEVSPQTIFHMPEGSVLVMPQRAKGYSGIPKPAHIETYRASGFGEKEYETLYGEESKRTIMKRYIAGGSVYERMCEYADGHNLDARKFYDQILNDGIFPDDLHIGADYRAYLDSLCREREKIATVRRVLRQQGYPVLSAGDDAWHDKKEDDRLKALARSMGVTSGRHVDTLYQRVEDTIMEFLENPERKLGVENELRGFNHELTPALIEMLRAYGIEIEK